MIVVTTELRIYGVQGQKFEILQNFLRDRIEFRACAGPCIFRDMLREIRDYVDDLNKKHNKTKEILFIHQDTMSYQQGQLNFFRPGSRYATLSLSYYRLNYYEALKKGGEGV